MKGAKKGVFGINYTGLDISAYIGPECGSRCRTSDFEQRLLADMEDYFACGFKYLYVEEVTAESFEIYNNGLGNENKSDLIYLLDIALKYEKKHGEGSCPVLINERNILNAQSGWKDFADVKDDIKYIYNLLTTKYPTIFAGYLLRDEPRMYFFDKFVEVYDYVYNELGGKDLVYLFSMLPTDGTIIGEPSFVPNFLLSEDEHELKIGGVQAFLTSDKYDGYLKKNVFGYIDKSYYVEYIYYLDKMATMLAEKNIKNVLFGCDIYPFKQVDDGFRNYYISCVQAISDICKKFGFQMFLTIQSYADTWIFKQFTNEAYISLQAFTALAYGCKHLSYFTYMEHFWQHDGHYSKCMLMLEEKNGQKQWKKTEYYDYVKSVNARLKDYEILTAFEHKGSFCYFGDNSDLLKKQREVIPYVDDNMQVLSSQHDILVGCFEHKGSKVKAYLLVNYANPELEEGTHVRIEIGRGVLFDLDGQQTDEREFLIENGAAKLFFILDN